MTNDMRTTLNKNKLELQNANNETHLITHWQLHPVNCVGADVLCSEVCHPAVMHHNSTPKKHKLVNEPFTCNDLRVAVD